MTIISFILVDSFGSRSSILAKGNQENALALCSNLIIFALATSLGAVVSLMEHREPTERPTSDTPENS